MATCNTALHASKRTEGRAGETDRCSDFVLFLKDRAGGGVLGPPAVAPEEGKG